jgi:lipopolysaccharide export system protein LptA
MRLERIFTHRLIRALRVVIPVLVLALIAIPAWNYLSRRAHVLPPKLTKQLPKNLDVRTEGFTYSRTEGGKTLFTIRADTSLGFKDNKYALEDVDVTVNGQTESDSPKRIRSKYCSYDQQRNDFKFEGNVEVQLDEKTSVRTEELTYNQESRTVIAPKEAIIDQPGSMNGRADSFEYGLDTGVLKLAGNVHVTTMPQTSLDAGSAVFQQKENWATMAGGVLIKSGSGWIRGQAGRADLEPGTYKPRTIAIETDVTAESKGQGGLTWKLHAGRLEADISPEGNAERVRTRGNVEVERVGGDSRQVMTGGEMDATLDASGKVTLVEARQDARMVFGTDRTLQSNVIWINGAGAIATQDEAVLHVGDSTIDGKEFTIQQGDIVRFTTKERANLRSGERRTSADRTEGRFDGRTNSLLELVQSGNFHFSEGTREGRAQNARFENGGAVVTLDGSPVVTDARMRLEAGQIRLDQKEGSFVATRNVKTVTRDSGEPVLVSAARAEGGADRITYTQNVQLWRGSAYIKAERLEAFSRNNSLHAEGGVHSNIEGVRATSDKLDYDDGSRLAHYTGNVRAEKQGSILETRDMTARLRDKDVEQIVAAGGVVVTQGDRRGTGEQAVYESATESVTLTGQNAEVFDKEQGTVHGTRLVMNTKGDSVTAEGGKGGRSVTKHPVSKR